MTAFGSGTWEYFGETNQASLNDFINTTLGGIALGEMLHRTAWLVIDPKATGGSRKKKEILATAIDPMNGVNRFISGDAHRVSRETLRIRPVGACLDDRCWRAVARIEHRRTCSRPSTHSLQVDLLYGDPTTGRSRTPYDAFAVRFDFGGGTAISEVRVRGRVLGQPYHNGAVQLTVSQGYQFNKNNAYQFGAQSVRDERVDDEGPVSDAFVLDRGVGRRHDSRRGRLGAPARRRSGPTSRSAPRGSRAGRVDGSTLLRLRSGNELRRDSFF